MKRKIFICLFIVIYALTSCFLASAEEKTIFMEYYVSALGDDNNTGEADFPFKTIERAMEAVRDISYKMTGDIIVNIGGGDYFLEKALDFTVADSGKNGYHVIYRGDKNDMPVISAGKRVSGFIPSPDYDGVFETTVEELNYIRELYVNDKMRYMAKSPRLVKGVKKPEKYDTQQWYASNPDAPAGDSYNFYDPNTSYPYDGIYMSKEDIGFYENIEDIELCWAIKWEGKVMHVRSIEPNPDNDSQVIVRMDPGLWNYQRIRNTNDNSPRGERAFYIRNAMELLDSPGEFYFNRRTKKLYYMPLPDENMADADVIVPRLDTIAFFNGNDINDKVKNITFEGLKFAHSASYTYSYGSTSHGQGGNIESSGGGRKITAAVKMKMADGISFTQNYFFGISNGAIDMITGVTNSNVTGNAFSDIGFSAVSVGRPNNRDNFLETVKAPPENPPSQLYLTNVLDSIVTSSYYGDTTYNINTLLGGSQFHFSAQNKTYTDNLENTEEYKSKPWKSDPYAPSRGEKSWVKYDFQREYSLSKITLLFSSDFISASEKSDFEILLSNDRDFKEYEVAATQAGAVGKIAEYSVALQNKYRYMMIRTTGATPLALNYAYAYTPDMKPYTMYERCKKINITNNYIVRPSVFSINGGGIMMFYTENVNILHNEVIDCPYSGIQLGWSWGSTFYGSYFNNVSYNYTENINRVIYDGGGVYNLGRNFGTVISNNYFNRLNTANGGIYPDQGSSSTLWHSNVIGNSAKAMHIWHPSIIENEVINNYSSGSLVENGTVSGANVIENLKIYNQGDPPAEAYSIMKNAGLEKKYEYLRSLPPIADNDLMSDYDLGGRSLSELAENIIAADKFGGEYGKYAIEYKYRLKKAVSAYNDSMETDSAAKLITLNTAVYEADNMLNRLDFSDMLSLCLKTAAESNKELYADGALEAFASEAASVEAASLENFTAFKEYELLTRLEKAYNLLETKIRAAGLNYVYVDGAKHVDINSQNKTITVTIPYYEALGTKNVEIWPHGSTQLADVINTVDLSLSRTIPLYSPIDGKYTYWTMTAVNETVDSSGDITPWYTQSTEKDAITMLSDGSVLLAASPYSFTLSKYQEGLNTVEFIPVTPNKLSKFSVVFGIKAYDEFEISNKNSKNNRYEIEFGSGSATLYYIKEGAKTALKTVLADIHFNAGNTLTYSFETAGTNSVVKVSMNGVKLFDEIGAKTSGFYMGFYNPKINIKVVN